MSVHKELSAGNLVGDPRTRKQQARKRSRANDQQAGKAKAQPCRKSTSGRRLKNDHSGTYPKTDTRRMRARVVRALRNG